MRTHSKAYSAMLKGGVCSALLAGIAFTSANAQDQSEQETFAEEIIITGSRIARDAFSSASPISVFDSEDIAAQGVVSIDEFLKDIPAFTGFQLGSTTNNGNDGQKKVDLRGLSFNRTLILFNGRRHVGDTTGDGAVDLNALPASMIERVEVLKDGASTAYGSDAIAGVVNIILKDDFEGVELSANYGAGLDDIDAENYSFSVLAGTSNDRGNITFGFEYNNQRELLQGQRPWAENDLFSLLNDDGEFEAVPSGSSNSRTIRNPGTLGGNPNAVNGNFVVDETTGQVRAFTNDDVFNFAPVNALITPNERYQLATLGHYDLFESDFLGNVEGYFEAMYTNRTSHQRLAPDASFSVDDDFQGTGLPNSFVPASNPFNPFGVNASGPDGILGTADDLNPFGIENEGVEVNRRFVESGGRLFTQTNHTWRIVGGLRGQFNDNIDWDFNYTYARIEDNEVTTNLHNFERWEILVDPNLCSEDASCPEVFNPFLFDTLTEEQAEFLFVSSLKDLTRSSLSDFQFTVNGDTNGLVEINGEPIGFAAGYERRTERGEFLPDVFVSSGLTTGGASSPLEGNFTVNEYFLETIIPIVRDLPFAQAIDVEASARHSNYNTSAGKTTNYRIGLNYTINDSFRVRGVYATGFRAPNIAELTTATSANFPLVEPFCEFAETRSDITQTIRDNCAALDAFTGEVGFAFQSTVIFEGPDEGLRPEESETYTIGAVFTPTFLPGFSLSVDYWNISVDDLIGLPDYNRVVFNCLNSENLSAAACDAFENGNPYNNFGGFLPSNATLSFGNLGRLETDGIDFNASYDANVEFGWVNNIFASVNGVWQHKREETFDLSGTVDTVGTAQGFAVFPEWKVNTRLGVRGDAFSFAWETRYFSGTDSLNRPAELTDDARAEAVFYNDIVGNVNWDRYTVTVGINNLFDVDPPRFHGAFNANTDPGVYDVIGRRIFARLAVNF